jgi:hypothetical protein
LHRWAGIGLGGRSVDDLIRSIKLFKPTLERWLRTRVLIVDEGQ